MAKPTKKSDSKEGILALVAALLVLFAAMISPLYSAGLAILLLIIFSIYKFVKN